MGKDELNVRAACGRIGDDEVHDDTSRIGGVFERLRTHTCQWISAAGRFDRMRINNGIPAILLIKYGIE